MKSKGTLKLKGKRKKGLKLESIGLNSIAKENRNCMGANQTNCLDFCYYKSIKQVMPTTSKILEGKGENSVLKDLNTLDTLHCLSTQEATQSI